MHNPKLPNIRTVLLPTVGAKDVVMTKDTLHQVFRSAQNE